MGETSASVALLIVIAVIAAIFLTPLGAWILNLFDSSFVVTSDTGSYLVTVTPEPVTGGWLNPLGDVWTFSNESLTVQATADDGFVFGSWIFDGVIVGQSPVYTVPPQPENSTHTLTGVFERLDNPVFAITPDLTAVAGQSATKNLYLVNNDDSVTISDIQLKLNDPYGIFEKFTCRSTWWGYGTTYVNVLNVFNSVGFVQAIGSSYARVTAIPPNTSYAYTPSPFIVSENIEAGVYELTWEIRFTADGNFNSPPDLTIPWSVTVYG